MKMKNIKLGDFLYFKTTDELEKSKYFEGKTSERVYFKNESRHFSYRLDGESCGKILQVINVDGEDITYRKKDGSLGKVSRHVFRKPTKEDFFK